MEPKEDGNARAYFQEGRYLAAIFSLNRALVPPKHTFNSAELFLLRACCHYQLYNFNSCVSDCDESLRCLPEESMTSEVAYLLKAYSLWRLGKYADTFRCLEDAEIVHGLDEGSYNHFMEYMMTGYDSTKRRNELQNSLLKHVYELATSEPLDTENSRDQNEQWDTTDSDSTNNVKTSLANVETSKTSVSARSETGVREQDPPGDVAGDERPQAMDVPAQTSSRAQNLGQSSLESFLDEDTELSWHISGIPDDKELETELQVNSPVHPPSFSSFYACQWSLNSVRCYSSGLATLFPIILSLNEHTFGSR